MMSENVLNDFFIRKLPFETCLDRFIAVKFITELNSFQNNVSHVTLPHKQDLKGTTARIGPRKSLNHRQRSEFNELFLRESKPY